MMMCLGMFVFSLSTLAYQDFQRQTEWKHPSNSRVGAMDAHQFTGKGADTITLKGWFAPEFNGTPLALNILRAMGDTGQSWMLVEGTGHIYGLWIITSLTEGRSYIDSNGGARKYEFSLTLKCADDNIGAVIGSFLPEGFNLPDIPKILNIYP